MFIAELSERTGLDSKEMERFLKFAVVGTIGFIVDFGTLTFLVEVGGLEPVFANVFSFSAAVMSNFMFNRYWTYPDSRSKNIMKQLGQFALVNILGLTINTMLLLALSHPFDILFEWTEIPVLLDRGYIPAKMGATVIVLFWNFFVNRYWTYNDVDSVTS